jgi:hypothetical protein
MSEARPASALPVTGFDRALMFMAAVGLALLVAAMAWVWPQVPADRWELLVIFVFLAGVGVLLYVALSMAIKVPHSYNYPWPITAQNRERQFLLARRMVLELRVVIVFAGVGIFLAAASSALGRPVGWASWILPAILGAIGVVFASYFAVASRAR